MEYLQLSYFSLFFTPFIPFSNTTFCFVFSILVFFCYSINLSKSSSLSGFPVGVFLLGISERTWKWWWLRRRYSSSLKRQHALLVVLGTSKDSGQAQHDSSSNLEKYSKKPSSSLSHRSSFSSKSVGYHKFPTKSAIVSKHSSLTDYRPRGHDVIRIANAELYSRKYIDTNKVSYTA